MSAFARSALLRREIEVARQVPYTAHVTPSVVRTSAGDFVQTFRLGGASFESADDATLNNWHERLNVLWRNVASPHVAIWTHILRRRERLLVGPRDRKGFAAALAHRYDGRLANETLMVNELYVSLVYRPITGAAPSLAARLLSRRAVVDDVASVQDAIEASDKLAQLLEASLARYEPERLGLYERAGCLCSAPLEFFGLLLNGESQPVPLPRAPIAEVLATTRPVFGSEVLEYRLPTSTRLGAILGIKEYSTPTTVGMFDALLAAPFSFVLTQSFTFLNRATAQGMLQRQQARMGNAADLAISQAEELTQALDAIASNVFAIGDHHLSLQVLVDQDASDVGDARRVQRLNDAVAAARTLLADTGMTVAREDLALEAAFWAQLPGNFRLRPRLAPITSRNFAAMSSFHNYPMGRALGNHWGRALAVLVSSAGSPYYFSLHASDPSAAEGGSRKDTGHTFLCGPTGSGKSVFMGFLMALLAERGATQVVFDKDHGLEILVRALGGRYLPLQLGVATNFNPLQLPESPENTEFLKLWLRALVRGEISAREESDLDQALRGTLSLDLEHRRLSRLIEFLDTTRPEGVYARLSRWCESTRGEYAWVFDNPEDAFSAAFDRQAIVGFDMTQLLDHPKLRGPATLYLFHCVGQRLNGSPFVCWADEFSRLLDDPAFAKFAKNGLKVWRKLNGVLVAAAQSASDALNSDISRTIIEQTATKVFFPNPDADVREYRRGFGLSEREFRLLSQELEPGSRRFLVKQGHVSMVCELDLRGFDGELAVISGRAESVARARALMAELGDAPQSWLPTFIAAYRHGSKDNGLRRAGSSEHSVSNASH